MNKTLCSHYVKNMTAITIAGNEECRDQLSKDNQYSSKLIKRGREEGKIKC